MSIGERERRDRFAAAALQGLLAADPEMTWCGEGPDDNPWEGVAGTAWRIADAMLSTEGRVRP
jgi:hypothetical protein